MRGPPEGYQMRKDTVRELRDERDRATAELKSATKVLREKFPEVKRYLDAEKNVEAALGFYRSAWTDLTQKQREALITEFSPIVRVRLDDAPIRRDMASELFFAALARRGFEYQERATRISGRIFIGHVLRWNDRDADYRIDYRETLKRVIEHARKLSVDVSGHTV